MAIPSRRFPFAFTRLARALAEVAQVSPHLPPPTPFGEPPAVSTAPPPQVLEPPKDLSANANLKEHLQAYQASIRDPEGFWGEWANTSIWTTPWKTVWNQSGGAWFEGGKTNIAFNAFDRHLPERRTQVALITLDGEGRLEKWTYGELHELSARLAGRLKVLGIQKGDRVALYLPTTLEAVITLLALARPDLTVIPHTGRLLLLGFLGFLLLAVLALLLEPFFLG